MNDSGFWVFCKMGGLTESEGLRSWTPITAIVGLTGLTTTLVLARLLPLV
jgi:H+/gluconate symporter-like permease